MSSHQKSCAPHVPSDVQNCSAYMHLVSIMLHTRCTFHWKERKCFERILQHDSVRCNNTTSICGNALFHTVVHLVHVCCITPTVRLLASLIPHWQSALSLPRCSSTNEPLIATVPWNSMRPELLTFIKIALASLLTLVLGTSVWHFQLGFANLVHCDTILLLHEVQQMC